MVTKSTTLIAGTIPCGSFFRNIQCVPVRWLIHRYFVVLIILLSQKKNTSRFNYSDFFKCTWLYLFCRRTNWPVKECWDNENKKRLFQIHFYTQRTDTASFYPVTWTCRIYSKAMQYLHRLCITQYCYIYCTCTALKNQCCEISEVVAQNGIYFIPMHF